MIAFEIISILNLIIFIFGFGIFIFSFVIVAKKIFTQVNTPLFRSSDAREYLRCSYCSQKIIDVRATHCPSCGASIKGERND